VNPNKIAFLKKINLAPADLPHRVRFYSVADWAAGLKSTAHDLECGDKRSAAPLSAREGTKAASRGIPLAAALQALPV